jgi:peptide deformylase
MGLRRIHTSDEPALHKVCKTVTSFDWRLRKLLDDMRDTLIDSNGVGLAAPQVGILKRVVLVDTGEEILELINPELIETSGEQTGVEGCLSVPGKYGIVTRPMIAKVRMQFRETAAGRLLPAAVFCIAFLSSFYLRMQKQGAQFPLRSLHRNESSPGVVPFGSKCAGKDRPLRLTLGRQSIGTHNSSYITHPKKSFRSSSTVPMPAIPKFCTKTLATLGDRKAGRVGPKWMFLTPR